MTPKIITRKHAPDRTGPKFGPYHLPLRRQIARIRRGHHRIGNAAYIRRHFA